MHAIQLHRDVTQWVQNSTGGRSQDPLSIARAWGAVLLHPVRFFRRDVTPGDQAPALFFLVGVVVIEETSRYLLVPGAAPVWQGRPTASAMLAVLLTAFLVAPAALHFIAALQTVLFILFVPDRGGISETVQVLAYATAPCVLAGVPIGPVRILCGLYGTVLLAIGMTIVHDSHPLRVVPLTFPAVVIGFGYAFRVFSVAPAFSL